MATKKITSKKSIPGKTAFYKIGAKIGKLAGGLIVGKDHLAEKADGVIDTVKSTIINITGLEKSIPEKTVKTTNKKAASKQLKPVTKKSAAVKKSSSSKKVSKSAASKKTTPAKKIIKKAVKKVAVKD